MHTADGVVNFALWVVELLIQVRLVALEVVFALGFFAKGFCQVVEGKFFVDVVVHFVVATRLCARSKHLEHCRHIPIGLLQREWVGGKRFFLNGVDVAGHTRGHSVYQRNTNDTNATGKTCKDGTSLFGKQVFE